MVHRWAQVIGPPIMERKARGRGPSPRAAPGGGSVPRGASPGLIARRRARMAERVAGIHYQGATLPETVALIRRADQAGVLSVWLTAGGLGADSLTTLAVAGTQTEQIQLGTSIVVTYSRHPVAMIQQAVAISQAAPGRFRLGIGPSHRSTIENTYGLPFERPLEHVREYTEILEQAFHGGEINFEGKRFRVKAQVPNPPAVPVYHAALRPVSYQLAGETA